MRTFCIAGVAIAFVSGCGCMSPGKSQDASVEPAADLMADAGVPLDAGGGEPIDGGPMSVVACISADQSRAILMLGGTLARRECLFLNLARADGGESPFPNFHPPAGYRLEDARWRLGCTNVQELDGGLNVELTASITDLWGNAEWGWIFQGRPRGLFIDGGVVMGPYTFSFDTNGSAIAVCPFPF